MIVINIENDMSHLRPYRNIKDCIIDLTDSTVESRLAMRTVLLNNNQIYTDDSFSDIWNHSNQTGITISQHTVVVILDNGTSQVLTQT